MPFVMDLFGQWGLCKVVAKCMLYSKCEIVPGWINEGGTKSLELQMQSAVWKYSPCGMLDCANKGWRHSHQGKLFGDTYAESSPRSWANNYLVHSTVRMLAQHVLPSMQVVEMAQQSTPQSTDGRQSAPVQRKVQGYYQYCAETQSLITQFYSHNVTSLGDSSVC